MEHRGITEQVLNLSCSEKNRIVDLLYENMMPLIIEMNQMLTQDLSSEEMAVFIRVLDKITARAKEMNAAQIIPEKVRGQKNKT